MKHIKKFTKNILKNFDKKKVSCIQDCVYIPNYGSYIFNKNKNYKIIEKRNNIIRVEVDNSTRKNLYPLCNEYYTFSMIKSEPSTIEYRISDYFPYFYDYFEE